MRQSSTGTTPDELGSASSKVNQTTALLARLAIGGIFLYVVLDIIAQLLPPHYSPISQAESDLAVGPYGYVMTINFVLRGLVSLALLLGIMRVMPRSLPALAGYILFGVWAVAALLLALFPTDLAGTPPTAHGVIHLLLALIAFICASIGELLIGSRLARDERWRSLNPVTQGVAVAALVVLLVMLARIGALHYGGLIERIFLGLILLWMLLIAYRLQSLPR
ncbi:MAG: DUF998 domain-containing protein [Ktedonobacterales bacterium]